MATQMLEFLTMVKITKTSYPPGTSAPVHAYILGLLAALLFAAHVVIVRLLSDRVDPLAFSAWRGTLGGVVLAAMHAPALMRQFSLHLIIKSTTVAALIYGLNQMLLAYGLVEAKSPLELSLAHLVPFFAVLAALAIRLEQASPLQIAGLLVGCATLTGQEWLRQSLIDGHAFGDMWGRGGAMLLGYSLVTGLAFALLRALTKLYSSGVLSGLILLSGGLILAAMSIDHLQATWTIISENPMLGLLSIYEILISTALAWLVMVKSIAALGIVQGTMFFFLTPSLTALITWLALDEAPHWSLAPVTLLVILAMLMMSYRPRRR